MANGTEGEASWSRQGKRPDHLQHQALHLTENSNMNCFMLTAVTLATFLFFNLRECHKSPASCVDRVRRPCVHAGSWRGDSGTKVIVTELRDSMEGVKQKTRKNKRKMQRWDICYLGLQSVYKELQANWQQCHYRTTKHYRYTQTRTASLYEARGTGMLMSLIYRTSECVT